MTTPGIYAALNANSKLFTLAQATTPNSLIGIDEDGLTHAPEAEAAVLGLTSPDGSQVITAYNNANCIIPLWAIPDWEENTLLVNPFCNIDLAALPGEVGAGCLLPAELVPEHAISGPLLVVAVGIGPASSAGLIPVIVLPAAPGADDDANQDISEGISVMYTRMVTGVNTALIPDGEAPVTRAPYGLLLTTSFLFTNVGDDPVTVTLNQGGGPGPQVTIAAGASYSLQAVLDPTQWQILANAAGVRMFMSVRSFLGEPAAQSTNDEVTDAVTLLVPPGGTQESYALASTDMFFCGLVLANNDSVNHDFIIEAIEIGSGDVVVAFPVSVSAGTWSGVPTATPGAPFISGGVGGANGPPTANVQWHIRLAEPVVDDSPYMARTLVIHRTTL